MKEMSELRELVFTTLFEYMLASGGDGDACLLCHNWQEAANGFEEWLEKNHPNFLTRLNHDGDVVFQGNQEGNQEGIVFTNFEYVPPSWVDCVVKVSRI